MQWHDDGIILGLKRHGESSVIAEVMTRAHGRHLGLVRGGRSRRMQAALQPGNGVGVTWRARLDEHLGLFQLEASKFRAARLMESPLGVHGVQALATLLRLLPERDPHPDLHDRLAVLLEDIDVPGTAGALYVRFELALLDELGFGLDLSACAASGTQADLIYVSPKTGRAVSRSAGAPYAARLLELPAFLTDETREPDSEAALAASFRLTGYFLNRHVFEPRGNAMPIARESFIRANFKRLGNVPSEG